MSYTLYRGSFFVFGRDILLASTILDRGFAVFSRMMFVNHHFIVTSSIITPWCLIMLTSTIIKHFIIITYYNILYLLINIGLLLHTLCRFYPSKIPQTLTQKNPQTQALHYAAYHGHLSCVTELLKSNPRKDAKRRRKWLGSWLVNVLTHRLG